MKKYLAVTLVLVLVLGMFAFAACGTPEKGDKGDNDAEFTFNSLYPTNEVSNKKLQGFMEYLGVEEA